MCILGGTERGEVGASGEGSQAANCAGKELAVTNVTTKCRKGTPELAVWEKDGETRWRIVVSGFLQETTKPRGTAMSQP